MVPPRSEKPQSSFGSLQSRSMHACEGESGGAAPRPLEDPLFVRYLISLGVDVKAAAEDPAALEDYACEFAWSKVAGASQDLLLGTEPTQEERASLSLLSNGKGVGESELYFKHWQNARNGEAAACTSLHRTSDGFTTNPSGGKEVSSQLGPSESASSESPVSAVGSVLAHQCRLGISPNRCATTDPLLSAGKGRELVTPSIGEGETTATAAGLGCGDDCRSSESWSTQFSGETKRRKMTWEGADLTTLV